MKRQFKLLLTLAGVSATLLLATTVKAATTSSTSTVVQPAPTKSNPATASKLPKKYTGRWYAYVTDDSSKKHGKVVHHYVVAKVDVSDQANQVAKFKITLYRTKSKKLTHLKYAGRVTNLFDTQKFTDRRTKKVSYILYPKLGNTLSTMTVRSIKVGKQKQASLTIWIKGLDMNGYLFRTKQRSHMWL